MNPQDGMQYWTKGDYLHRLYVDRNPLLLGSNISGDTKNLTSSLWEKINELKGKEDTALINFDLFITGKSGNATSGLRRLKEILRGSSGVVNTLNEIAVQAYEQYPDLNIASEEGKKIITDFIVDYFNETYSINNNTDRELGKVYSSIYDNLIDEINQLPYGKENITSLSGFKGLANEKLIHALMNYNIYHALEDSKNQASIDRAIEKLEDEAYYISKNIGDNFVKGGRRSSIDEVIQIPLKDGIGEIPLQLKTKPKSTETTIQFVQRMEIDRLLSEASVDTTARRAIKTALINQHYWATGSYKRLVEAAAKKQHYALPGNIGSIHPTAIERLDDSAVLEPFSNITKSFASAIMYNVITGINEQMKVLFYIVAGQDGYTVIRSSDLLKNIFGKNSIKKSAIENIKNSGRMRIEGTPIIDKSVESYFSQDDGSGYRKNAIVKAPLPRSEWHDSTSTIVNSVYEKMAVTLSFNYGNIGSHIKEV